MGCILVFFLLMKFVGQVHNFNFRVFNGLFHIIFVSLAIREYKSKFSKEFNYLSGTATGIITSMVGVIPFAIFIAAYLAIDTQLMLELQENVPHIGRYLTPITSGITILMEGLAITFILSYIITRIVDAH